MKINFWKVESIGNDFVLLMEDEVGSIDLEILAQNICRRKFSIGADGLLVVAKTSGGIRMRMFNPDGTEDFCGNGMRCAAQFASERKWVGREFEIEHGSLKIPAWVAGANFGTALAPASFRPEDVPHLAASELFESCIEGITLSALTTGSTHTIIFADSLPADEEFEKIGHLLEHHPLFPKRTSVIWAKVLAERSFEIRIWERGVGETLGCGTGSGAVVAAYSRRTGQTGEFTVQNPGGVANIAVLRWDYPIRVEAEAKIVFRGTALVDAPPMTPTRC